MFLSTGSRSNNGSMVVILNSLCSTEELIMHFQLLSSMKLLTVKVRLCTWLKASTTMFSGVLPLKHGLWIIVKANMTTKHSCSNSIQQLPNFQTHFTHIINIRQSDVGKINWVCLDMGEIWAYMEINRITRAILISDKHTCHQMDGHINLEMQGSIWLGRISLKSKRLKYLLSNSSDY